MAYSHVIRGEQYNFADLKALLAKANEPKSGDLLAGLAAKNERERIAAKMALADLPLREFLAHPILDPDSDDVSKVIFDTHNSVAFKPIASLTVGELREYLLQDLPQGAELKNLQQGLNPEMVAAVTKLLANKELIAIAAKIKNIARCRNTTGIAGTLGVR
ncbi:MAG: ethanolamine ammonia lyase large subunit, partial [Planctomycetota bacterium]